MKFPTTSLALIAAFGASNHHPALAQDGINILCTDMEEGCIPCELSQDNPFSSRRRRYEIRDMPRDQWDAYVDAMWTMKNITMEEGQEKYGPLFKTHDYMVLNHAVTATSQRGDQGHFSSAFTSWHAAFSLMYETTLMQIAKVNGNELEGLPYFWNIGEDASDVLSPDYYGTHPGLGPNYEVSDGSFAYWPVSMSFDLMDYAEYMTDPTESLYAGNEDGSLRAAFNPLNSSFLTAFPWTNPVTGELESYTGASLSLIHI